MTTPAKVYPDGSHVQAEIRTNTTTDMQLTLLLDSDGHSVADQSLVNQARIHQWCLASLRKQAMLDLSSVSRIELSVQWLDSAAMQQLNQQYRGKNSPTNVLSFPADMPLLSTPTHSAGLLALGDLVLCPEVIQAEAVAQRKALMHHWAHMVVHGSLHLCGYDHECTADAGTMEALEIRILSELGLPDPYKDL